MDHNVQNATGGLAGALYLTCIWMANLFVQMNPNTIITILTAIGSILYGVNQALTLIKTLRNKKNK